MRRIRIFTFFFSFLFRVSFAVELVFLGQIAFDTDPQREQGPTEFEQRCDENVGSDGVAYEIGFVREKVSAKTFDVKVFLISLDSVPSLMEPIYCKNITNVNTLLFRSLHVTFTFSS